MKPNLIMICILDIYNKIVNRCIEKYFNNIYQGNKYRNTIGRINNCNLYKIYIYIYICCVCGVSIIPIVRILCEGLPGTGRVKQAKPHSESVCPKNGNCLYSKNID